MKDNIRQEFNEKGYIVKTILAPEEIAPLKKAADELMAHEIYQAQKKLHQVSFLQPEFKAQKLHDIIHHPLILQTVEKLLGPRLIIDNAALLMGDPGAEYKQGWHRDVLQIPEHLIDESVFSADIFHNNVQINLALVEDACFWAVPGSHIRPNSEAENIAFGGSKHMSPVTAQMPEGISIKLQPGQAAFYNNNMIHRGYCGLLTKPRRTIHLGYHSATHKPTYHFYVLKFAEYTPEYLATLTPEVRKMLEEHIAERKKYPDVSGTHGDHQSFLKRNF